MKRNFVKFLALSAAISLSSCYKDDIENLQNDLDNLKEEVAQMEEAQRAALLEQIATLQAKIAELENQDGNLSGDISGLQQALQDLANEIASNEAAIFYGNLTTDGEYARFADQGATIVTGNVEVRSAADAADLANLEYVRGGMSVGAEGDVSLPMLKAVLGSFEVGFSAKVNAAELNTVGAVNIRGKAFDAPKLVYVYGGLNMMGGYENINLPALASIEGDLFFYNYGWDAAITMGAMDISGNAFLGGISPSKITINSVGGNFSISENEGFEIEYLGDAIGGDFAMEYSGFYGDGLLSLPNLTTVGGDFRFVQNVASGIGGSQPTSLTDFSVFDGIQTVGGDFVMTGNKLFNIVGFNNITSIGGNVEISDGPHVEMVNVLNGLTQAQNVKLKTSAKSILAFEALETAKMVEFEAKKGFTTAFVDFEYVEVLVFPMLTEAEYVNLELADVTYFDGFNSFTTLTADTGLETKMEVVLPMDESVELCSMNNFLNDMLNAYDGSEEFKKQIVFYEYDAQNSEYVPYPNYVQGVDYEWTNSGWINYTFGMSCSGGGIGIGF